MHKERTDAAAHIAYCVPLIKIADFLSAGVHVKVLLAGELSINEEC